MMVKITERCTMGCRHCMNSASSDGKDMELDVFKDVLEFLRDNRLARTVLVLTGGEPTEHKNFGDIISCLIDFQRENNCFTEITITTNGELISGDPELFKEYISRAKTVGLILMYQISADIRYYPRRIETSKRIFREPGFVLCDSCVEQVYPQGRALENNIPWKSAASRCFNVRALSKQLNSVTLRDIERVLEERMKFCTPHIKVDGGIGLGESDLCPKCASIYDEAEYIIRSIQEFKCGKCDMINRNLNPVYKRFVD